MMRVYTYTEVEHNLKGILNTAKDVGKVLFQTNDGTLFAITPEPLKASPFDIDGIQTDITTEEILMFIRESREWGENNIDNS